MKKQFIISLILLTTYSAISQIASTKTDVEKLKINGSILTLVQSTYKAAEIGGKVINETLNSKAKYTFNKNGFLIESIVENPDKQLWYLPEKIATTYKYDTNDIIIETKAEEDTVIKIKSFVYDNLGNCIETKEYNQGKGLLIDKSEFKYNSNNQLLEVNSSNVTNSTNRSFKYDANNNLEEEFWTHKTDGEIHTTSYTYKYNQNNLEIESVYRNEEHEIYIITTAYDSANNPILKTTEDAICKYTYTYDTQHNWTKCIQIINDVQYIITEREITYN